MGKERGKHNKNKVRIMDCVKYNSWKEGTFILTDDIFQKESISAFIWLQLVTGFVK
jgi:hypothetical protein